MTNMDFFQFVSELPDTSWKKKFIDLGKLPIEPIRQSNIATYLECPKQALLYEASKLDTTSVNIVRADAILGTVFHLAIEEAFKDPEWIRHASSEYWRQLLQDVCTMENVEYKNYQDYAFRMCVRNNFGGKSLSEIVEEIVKLINLFKLEIIAVEKKILFKIGKITFQGTMDLLLRHPDGSISLPDIKTTGLFEKVLERGTSKKYAPSESKLKYSPQLNHYAWLCWRSGLLKEYNIDKIDKIGFILPTNLVPYVRGSAAGQIKGSPIFLEDFNMDSLYRYEQDLYQWLKLMASGYDARH